MNSGQELRLARSAPGWARRAEAWFDATTKDLGRVRQGGFEAMLLLSFGAAVHSGTAQAKLDFIAPDSVPAMRWLMLGWAALHPLLFLAGRRLKPATVHLAFLLGILLVMEATFRLLDAPWKEHLGIRLANLGTLVCMGFMLLPVKRAWLLSAAVAALELALPLPSGTSLPKADQAIYTFPVAISFILVVLAAILVERLQRRLAEHNARLEAEVAERAAVIERQQQALLQAQKLEAVGTLAAGLAHDFNNLMAVVLGYARELRREAEPGDLVGKAADVIDSSARRAADLTGRLLGFAQQGKVLDVAIDLHQGVDAALSLVSRNLGGGIRVVRELGAERPFVRGDPVQLQQVIVNLVLNARDAMPGGGTLTVASSLLSLAGHAVLEDGPYVALEVRDTGAGIPEAIRGRVFDPFFTTKPQGAGTGLGLAMVYGIAKAHRGEVTLQSEVGKGTCFRVLLPATEERPAAQPSRPPRPAPGRGVLVVLGRDEVLAGLSQRVRLLATSPAEADWLEARTFVRAHAQELDLMLLDRGRT